MGPRRNVPFGAYGDHEPNICIEIGAPANRRRAEGSLYVLETAFTVQRALCTFEGKGHPVHEALCTFTGEGPCHPNAAKVGPNSLKFQMDAKVHPTPRAAGVLSLSRTGQSFGLFKPNGTELQKKS